MFGKSFFYNSIVDWINEFEKIDWNIEQDAEKSIFILLLITKLILIKNFEDLGLIVDRKIENNIFKFI